MKLIRTSAYTLSVLLPLMLCFAVPVQAEEQEQHDSYYLEQMRNMSKGQNKKPGQELTPERESTDLLADTDLKELSKNETDFSSIGDIKPEFEKPKLDILKPSL